MTLASPGSSDLWAFLDAFSWELWVIILVTLLGFGLLLWLIERWWALGQPREMLRQVPSLHDRVFLSIGRPMQVSGVMGVQGSAAWLHALLRLRSTLHTCADC